MPHPDFHFPRLFRDQLVAGAVSLLVIGAMRSCVFADDPATDHEIIVRRADNAHVLAKSIDSEPNGLKKKEIQDKVNSERTAIAGQLADVIRTKGLKGWSATVDAISSSGGMRVKCGEATNFLVFFDGMTEDVKAVVRELKVGDRIVLTATANPTLLRVDAFESAKFQGHIVGKSVTSIKRDK